ncbi:RraA family protein [Kitasatospora sp. NBC_00315]|uniref:RraA family protein n=1 Tax=Kitasatospora sp. NBC_00315 TaxID=2975963 RepID=UPI00324D20FF
MSAPVEHRFDEAAIARLRGEFGQVSTSQLADAAGDLVTPLRLPLQARNGLPRIAGPAFPVATDDDMLPCLQALAATPPGWILLLVNERQPSEALAGDILTASALAQRLGGLVVDGAVRDLDDLLDLPIPVFSTEVTLVSARTTRERAPHVPQTVRTGGVQVHPGDWLIGDADGFIVLPAERVTAVLSAGRLLRAREDRLKQSIRDGAGSLAELTGLADFLAGTGELRFEV